MTGDADRGVVQVGALCLHLPATMAATVEQHASTAPGGKVQHLRMEYADLGAVLEIVMEPAAPAEREGMLGRLPPLLEALRARGLELNKVRSRRRRAGHLEGEEVVLRVQQGTASHALYLWVGSDREQDGGDAEQTPAGACRMVMQMSVPEPHVERGLDLWDRALDSAAPAERDH